MRFFLFLICSFSLFSSVTIKDFNANYLDYSGEGDFSFFQLNDQKWDNEVFTLDYQDGELKILFDGQELSLENVPSSIKDISSISMKNLNVDTSIDNITSLSVKSFEGEGTESQIKLEDIVLNCSQDGQAFSFLEDVIRNCLTTGDVTETLISIDTAKGKSVFRDGFIQIRNGEILIVADASAGFIGRLKIKGFGTYDKSKKIITLKVKSAKLGIFSFVGKLLSQLKEAESDFLKVDKSKKEIYLDISTIL